MRKHPWFHGYIEGDVTINGKDAKKASNYMASVRGLVEMADYMRKYGEVKKLEAPVSTTSVVFALTGINVAFEKDGKIGSQTWKEIDKNCAKVNGKVPKDCRSLLIYGMAMHPIPPKNNI